MSYLDDEKSWMQRDFGLDKRLIKALSKLGYVYPTLVQAKSLPLALQGKDLLVRARTGSGKTVAFALPILHNILLEKENQTASSSGNTINRIRALILVPTKELCKQIEKNITDLMYYIRDHVTICALLEENMSVLQFNLQSKPDIIVSTPARIVQMIRAGHVDLSHATTLILDEADLILSFGYAADIQMIINKLPKIFQGMFMSATLSPELDKFKKIVLHNPAILKLEESQSVGHLLQFYLELSENDKFLVLYVFMKLGLLQGKGLIFVNDVNKCYKLKLFLQQFYIPAAVLNAEVPLNSRIHIIEEFNRGVFDFLIATDAAVDRGQDNESDDDDDNDNEDNGDSNNKTTNNDNDDDDNDQENNDDNDEVDDDDDNDDDDNDDDDDDDDNDDDDDEDDDDDANDADDAFMDDDDDDEDNEGNDNELDEDNIIEDENVDADISNEDSSKAKDKKKGKGSKASKTRDDYGVSRGIDFQGVSFVINFDFPLTSSAYTHRIGRTARGGASGTALSFVTKFTPGMNVTDSEVAYKDSNTLQQVRSEQPRLGIVEGDNVLGNMGSSEEVDEKDETRMQPAPLMFNMKELDNFRYRVEDTLRSVTQATVKEMRNAEIKREILNSAQLKSYFSENPNDLKVLRHDKAVLHPIKQKDHLKHVPQYLIPSSMRSVANISTNRKKRKRKGQSSQVQNVNHSKMKDPLLNPDSVDDSKASDVSTKVFTNNEELGDSTSGRKAWKMRHKKGQFNPKMKNKDSHRTPGSFIKSKRYK